jgi:hypothetical protein
MKPAVSYVVSLSLAIACVPGLAQVQSPMATPSPQPSEALPPGPNPDSQYRLGPDSLPQEGVPKGEVRGPYTLPCKVYPGTQHTYWVYVPAQYDPSVPTALMVYQDGQAFKDENGDIRAQNVMDNLIYRREIPVMIGVFINPGRRPDQPEPSPQTTWGMNLHGQKFGGAIMPDMMRWLWRDTPVSTDPKDLVERAFRQPMGKTN